MFFKTIKLNEAIELIDKNFIKPSHTELVLLKDSLNKIIAQDIFSNIDLPSFNRSTVDGYAIRSNDINGASEFSPIPLNYIGEIKMGDINNSSLKPNECMYIPTGGMIPNNSDTMVMIEDCDSLEDEILINKNISRLSNIIFKGSEIKKGELLIKKNEKITSSHIGVLASMGIEKIEVFKKINFSIISTGDEVVEIGNKLKLGEVYDINTHLFSSLIKEAGGEVKTTILLKDNLESLSENLLASLETSDVVLISGGSSVGTRDFTEGAIANIGGEIFVHGISLKPGKPTIIAKFKNKLIFGMPGHPQSGVTVFKALIQSGILNKKRKIIYGELAENIYGDPGKTCFLNVKLTLENQKIKIYPLTSKSSMVRPLLDSDGYIEIPEHREGFYKNEIIEVILND